MLQAEEEFKEQREEHREQLEAARRESAGALLQAARLQRALSKAEEALEAERSAASTRLAQAAVAAQAAGAQQAADWSAERAQLLLNSQQLAEQLEEVQEQAHQAHLAQVCPVLTMLLRAAVQDVPLLHIGPCQPTKPSCKHRDVALCIERAHQGLVRVTSEFVSATGIATSACWR